jgi:hypothetical protein
LEPVIEILHGSSRVFGRLQDVLCHKIQMAMPGESVIYIKWTSSWNPLWLKKSNLNQFYWDGITINRVVEDLSLPSIDDCWGSDDCGVSHSLDYSNWRACGMAGDTSLVVRGKQAGEVIFTSGQQILFFLQLSVSLFLMLLRASKVARMDRKVSRLWSRFMHRAVLPRDIRELGTGTQDCFT